MIRTANLTPSLGMLLLLLSPPVLSQEGADEPSEVSDLPLLGIYYGIAACSAVPTCVFGVPLAQGLFSFALGERLFSKSYEGWWHGVLAGYGVYAIGLVATIGTIVGLTIYAENLPSHIDPGPFDRAAAVSAVAIPFVTVLVVEPLVAWSFGSAAPEQ